MRILVSSVLFLAVANGNLLKDQINSRQMEKRILDRVLNVDQYDKRIRPMSNGGSRTSTVVTVNTYLRAIERIDDYKMEYSVQLTFRQNWVDSRLAYDDLRGTIKYLTMTEAGKVWMPDTFFQNEKNGHFHNTILPNVYIRIFPDGNVLYSIRISLTLACPMDLKLYPLDRQICELRIASYGWTADHLIYRWKEENPVQIVQDLNLPRFKLESLETTYCNSITNTGEYSCLKVRLIFKREFSYYLLTLYVPSCMLVIVSWVSFWLDPKSVPARVTLGVTTLLTMSTQTAGVNRSLPPVAYTKAIDVWSGACVIFVFSSLLEFALVNYASRHDRRKRRKVGIRYRNYDSDEENTEDMVVITTLTATKTVNFNPKRSWLAAKFPTRSKRIDVVARVVFPVIFAVFNMSYWIYYLYMEQHF